MWFPFQTQWLEDQDVKWTSSDGRQASVANECPTEQMLFGTGDDIQVI